MLIRYVCKYCGTIYKTKNDALKCEKAAERMKPKFKKGDIVSDENGYKYKVLRVERWQVDFDKALKKILYNADIDIPLEEHTFLCVLEALEPPYRNERLSNAVTYYAILKQPLPHKGDTPVKKGILLENEIRLRKVSKKDS